MSRRGRTAAVIGATALGAWLIIRGLINLLWGWSAADRLRQPLLDSGELGR